MLGASYAISQSLSLEIGLTHSASESVAVVLNSTACVSVPLVQPAVPQWAALGHSRSAYSEVVNSIVKQTPAGNFLGQFFWETVRVHLLQTDLDLLSEFFFAVFADRFPPLCEWPVLREPNFPILPAYFFSEFFFCS